MGDKNHDEAFEDLDVVEEDNLEPTDALKKLRAKLKACEVEKTANLDGWQRAQADLANLKRDTITREQKARAQGCADMVSAMAPALDSFHMAMQGKGWDDMPKEWKVGIHGIYQQLTSVLSEQGLQIIDPIGNEFDPNEHESVSIQPVDSETQDHIVQQTIQKGFKLHDQVIRPAKVVVGEYDTKA